MKRRVAPSCQRTLQRVLARGRTHTQQQPAGKCPCFVNTVNTFFHLSRAWFGKSIVSHRKVRDRKERASVLRTELAFRTSLPAAEQSSLFPITTVPPPPPLLPLVLEGALPQFAYCTAVILFACEFGQAKRIFFPAHPTQYRWQVSYLRRCCWP